MRTPLVLAALLLAAPASAQLSGGLRGGLNTAFFSGRDALGTDPRLGAVGGAFVRYSVTPAVAVQVEALYSQEGAEEPDRVDPGTYVFDYVDIPVLVRLGVPVSRLADAGVYVGPSFGVPVRAEFDADLDDDIDELGRGRRLRDGLGTDVGVTVGADFWAGPVGVDLRYTAGVKDVFNDDAPDNLGLGNVRNQVFAVTLGVRFGAYENERVPRRRPRRPY